MPTEQTKAANIDDRTGASPGPEAERSLVASLPPPLHGEMDTPPTVAAVGNLPVRLNVSVPLRNFQVRDLLSLAKDRVLETEWPPTEDVPLWCGSVQLVWLEFEVVDQELAVRVTRLV